MYGRNSITRCLLTYLMLYIYFNHAYPVTHTYIPYTIAHTLHPNIPTRSKEWAVEFVLLLWSYISKL